MLPKDFHLEARYYYTTLNDEEKRLYLFMLDCFLKHQYKFRYTMFPDFIPQGDALPAFIHGMEEYSDVCKVYNAVIWDCPELYYISCSDFEFKEEGYFQFGSGNGEYTNEEIEEIDKRLDEIYHKFDSITDDFELEVAVHDYILDKYDYEFEDGELNGRSKEEIFTVVGMIKTGEAVCAAFSRMAQYIFQRRGIPTVNIIAMAGEDDEEKELHSWLAVKIKGNYYHVDITFDESSEKDSEIPPYMNFNLTDNEIRTNHEFLYEEYPNIVCDSYEFNYYHRMGLFFDTKEKVSLGIGKFVEENKGCGKIKYFYFRVPLDLSEDEIREGLIIGTRRDAVKEASFISYGEYYTVVATFK